MKICYLFASRSRPDKFFRCLDNIKSLSASNNYEILVVLDLDDDAMANIEIRRKLIIDYPQLIVNYGTSTGKVNAINRGVKYIGKDVSIVCVHSDDFVFIKHGFDDDIREAFADGFNGLAHFPDNLQGIRLVTYPIMSKQYLDKFGYVYNDEYTSLYCDNEMTEVAKTLGMYKYSNKNIFRHEHYKSDKSKPDELMLRNDSKEMYALDKAVYLKRKEINFGIV